MIWMSDVVVGVGIADTAATATSEMSLKICMLAQVNWHLE